MQKSMKTLPIEQIKPYENNPRLNDDAVEAVRKSMEQCGYIAPIVVDENNVVLAGHTRLKALKEMGAKECEVLKVEGLSDDEKRKYRLLDNKTNELALWDFDKLAEELEGLDFDDFELDWDVCDTDFIDELLSDGVEGYNKIESPYFSVTFTFDKALKDKWDDFVDAYGKEAVQSIIEKAIGGN